jgi:PTH1 family peptidyl-tRNA hydrolase
VQLILGLGNLGAEYEKTRHNVGFDVLDVVAERLGRSFLQRGRALVARGEVEDRPYLLAKPTTFMNRSGRAARDLLADLEGPAQLLVLCDDFHLPLGQLRCRRKGSSGGQNGLASILEMVPEGQEVPRLRLGIGDPGRKPAEVFVLERFKRSEQQPADDMVLRAADHVIDWLGDGDLERLVNRANAPLV